MIIISAKPCSCWIFSDYNKTLDKLAETKWKALKGEQYINRQVKTTRYLLQKGFENAMISAAIKKLMADGKKNIKFLSKMEKKDLQTKYFVLPTSYLKTEQR